MMKPNSVPQRIATFIERQENGKLFIYKDFEACGNYASIRSAVVYLCKLKKLIRIWQGVYIKPNKLGDITLPTNLQLIKEIDRRKGGILTPKGETKKYIERKIKKQPHTLQFYTTSSSRKLILPDGTIVKLYHTKN